MKLNATIIAFLIICTLPKAGYAQDTTVVSLDDLVSIAIENNHDLKIARNDLQATRNSATMSNAGLLPDLSLSGNGSYSSQDTEAEFSTGIPSESQKNAETIIYGGSVDVNWTVFDGFYSLTNFDQLKAQALLSDIILQTDIENTIVSVALDYYNLVSIQNDYATTLETYTISKERLIKTERDLNFGQGSESERLNALSALNTDTLQLINLVNSEYNAIAGLLKTLGVDSLGINVNFYPSTELMGLDYDQLKAQLELSNLSMIQSRSNLGISNLQYKMSKADRFPKLSFNIGYAYNYSTYEVGIMKFNQALGWTSGLVLSYNITDFGKRKNEIQNAKISVQNSQLNLEKTKLQVTQDFEIAWNDYQLHLQTIELEGNNLTVEQDRFKRIAADYYLGQTDNLSFRDAQLSLARIKDQLFDARLNCKVGELELLRLTGSLLK